MSFIDIGLDDSYGLSQAGQGIYKVTLRVNGREESKNLLMREDPLLKQ